VALLMIDGELGGRAAEGGEEGEAD
jgi:hypothetical protein